jgi:hypothetical protein
VIVHVSDILGYCISEFLPPKHADTHAHTHDQNSLIAQSVEKKWEQNALVRESSPATQGPPVP